MKTKEMDYLEFNEMTIATIANFGLTSFTKITPNQDKPQVLFEIKFSSKNYSNIIKFIFDEFDTEATIYKEDGSIYITTNNEYIVFELS